MKPKHFINCYVPTQACNFRCAYCYIGQRKDFDNKLFKCIYPISTMQRATTVERMGGICIFNLCAGGETLLSKEIIPVIHMLLDNGHNVSVVTNGTISERFDELLLLPDVLQDFLYIKFSFHYFELVRTGMLENFWKNVKKIKESKISFSVDITPCDELIKYIPEIKELFEVNMNGAMPHISVARDTTDNSLKILSKLSKNEYQKVWSVFNSKKFDYKINEFLKPHNEYCYAGKYSFSLELATGNCRICDGAPNPKEMNFYNLYENPDEEISFKEIGTNCPMAHCYNCHALLTLGTIPELNTPSYADMLDRVDNNGDHWLKPKVYDFYSKKIDTE
ncbi:MAG: radical SAM protein [Lachnospiraceae bacterium]|nr:radical SAM protein [Lachnospiraceae bacterium]